MFAKTECRYIGINDHQSATWREWKKKLRCEMKTRKKWTKQNGNETKCRRKTLALWINNFVGSFFHIYCRLPSHRRMSQGQTSNRLPTLFEHFRSILVFSRDISSVFFSRFTKQLSLFCRFESSISLNAAVHADNNYRMAILFFAFVYDLPVCWHSRRRASSERSAT